MAPGRAVVRHWGHRDRDVPKVASQVASNGILLGFIIRCSGVPIRYHTGGTGRNPDALCGKRTGVSKADWRDAGLSLCVQGGFCNNLRMA